MTDNAVTIDPEAIAIWLGLVLTVVGAVVASVRWLHKQLEKEVRQATSQIQPNANGGSSLADANRTVDKLTESLKRIHTRLDAMEQRSVEQARDMDSLLGWAQGRPCLWQIDRGLKKAQDEADRREAGSAHGELDVR